MQKRIRYTFFYLTIIGLFVLSMFWIVQTGQELEDNQGANVPTIENNAWLEFLDTISHNLAHPLALLLAQIVTIIVVARIFSWICKSIGQPTVIGEILAGIFLGPSFIGMYFPGFSEALFPVESLNNLQLLSQIGLILFMFIVGMELDLKTLRSKAYDAFIISQTSIMFPFALGMGLAYFIYNTYAPQEVKFSSFGLFIAIAMSITAFPVLARIVHEREMHKTRLGTIVITCAAVDDVTAWSILAAVIAIVRAGSFVSALYIIFLAIVYVLIMILVIRPFLQRVGEVHSSRENLNKPVVAIFFLMLISSSYATEIIGIHALFGAFMAGAIMPDNLKFRNVFIEKVEDIALVLLLPLFFVFTGLRTEIGLLNTPSLWYVAALILLVAITGKFVGSALAAKFVGQSWRDSLSIGALMNTRGLMELVVLNIGYDLGILSPEIFAMMVLMALITTFMTGPALSLINYRKFAAPVSKESPGTASGNFDILISFANPQKGRSLLRLANGLTRGDTCNSTLTLMHLSPNNELNQVNIDKYQEDSFAPVIAEARRLKQDFTTFFRVSNEIIPEIIHTANKGNYDLLMVGIGQSIYEGSILGKILRFFARFTDPGRIMQYVFSKTTNSSKIPFEDSTRQIINGSKIPVGILLDKKLSSTNRIVCPVFNQSDMILLKYIRKFLGNGEAIVTLIDFNDLLVKPENYELISNMPGKEQDKLLVIPKTEPDQTFLKQFDLMITSLSSWKFLSEIHASWINKTPSVLIISERQNNR